MTAFERHRRSGRIIATFTGFEADLLRSLTSQMVELLRNERAEPAAASSDPFEAMMAEFSGATTIPEDPVLARLFPNAYPDDEDAAADFRRFTEGGLRDGKAAASGLVIDALEEAGLPPELTEEGLVIDVELSEPDAEAWMRAFTDIRLALATRLEVRSGDEDYWDSLPDDDPRAQAHDIYEWVGWLQESIIEALTA
ncbi:MAG: DUF2017 domain-containing protein [Nocardioides sp.]|nr:DUF2017 domain-containing protein [Nocardioides sp.]